MVADDEARVRLVDRPRRREATSRTAERSLERRSNHFHVVLFCESPICLRIHALPFFEHLFKSPWRHADQYHARLSPSVLKGVCRPSRDEHDRLSGRAHDAVTKLELKLTLHDVEELVLRLVDVRGWPTLGRNGLTKQSYRSAGLLAGRHYFGHIPFSALRPREPRGTVWQNDEPRFCGDRGEKPNGYHHSGSGEQGHHNPGHVEPRPSARTQLHGVVPPCQRTLFQLRVIAARRASVLLMIVPSSPKCSKPPLGRLHFREFRRRLVSRQLRSKSERSPGPAQCIRN